MNLANEITTKETRSSRDKSRLVINVEYGDLLAEAGLATFADFFHYAEGVLIKRIPDRTVTRITLKERGFYLKRHLLEIRRSWQQPLLGRGAGESELSEGASEFNNYCLFRQRGLATAVPVAMGEREVEGGGMESFLLTRDFAPLIALETIIRQTPHLLAGPGNRDKRQQALLAAADYARRMHQSGLNHLDFNATHILLQPFGVQEQRPQAAVFDLQRVASNIMASWRWPIKTLAELNFTLPRELFDDGERLFMLTIYLGKERLTPLDRLLWRAILAKTAKIERHARKRWARRRQERARSAREERGVEHLLIHHEQRKGLLQPVTVERVVRRVPGSREVGAGHWESRPIIVKAFQGKRRQRQLAREWQGLTTLGERGIDAPRPLFSGEDSRGRQVLVLERIEEAVSAADLPALRTPEGTELRAGLMRALAAQHRKGVEQGDLHLGNFLLQGQRVFALDPAEMRFSPYPLGVDRSLAQLAAMGALFPELGAEEFSALALVYAQARHWCLSERTLDRLETRRQEIIVAKLRQRLKKYGRRNTRHGEVESRNYRLLFDRRTGWECGEPEELAALLRAAARDQRAAHTGRPLLFTWGQRHLAAYLINEGPLGKRLLKAIWPGQKRALRIWQDLYRQQATTRAPGLTPVGLLQPRSPWSGLSSFVIIEASSDLSLPLSFPTSQALLFPPRRS